MPVTVDVERVGPGDSGQVRDRGRQPSKAERTAHRALVPVERGRLAPTGEEQIGTPVVVAVQSGHPTSDEVLELPVVPVVDARHRRLFHEPRGDRLRRPTAARDGHCERDRAGGHQRECAEQPPSRAPDRRAARRVPNGSGRRVGHDRIEPQRAFRHGSRRRHGSSARPAASDPELARPADSGRLASSFGACVLDARRPRVPPIDEAAVGERM